MPSTSPAQRGARGTRVQQALNTRRTMIIAAYRLFCDRGYAGTTIKDIAEEAGVAVQTVYFTFHTKAAILGEVVGAAVQGFDRWAKASPEPIATADLLSMLDWYGEFQASPHTRHALEIFIQHTASVLGRMGPLVAAIHAGSGEPEAAAVLRVGEQRRVDTYREIVRALARKGGGLRAELSEDTATDILLVMASAEVYHALSAGRGWSPQQCTGFLLDVLAGQLLDDTRG